MPVIGGSGGGNRLYWVHVAAYHQSVPSLDERWWEPTRLLALESAVSAGLAGRSDIGGVSAVGDTPTPEAVAGALVDTGGGGAVLFQSASSLILGVPNMKSRDYAVVSTLLTWR